MHLLLSASPCAGFDCTATVLRLPFSSVQKHLLSDSLQCPIHAVPVLQAEIARIEASNASQAAALKEQEAQLKEKEKEVLAGQAGLEKQTQQVEKKGRELDTLNRKYEKAMADVPKGEDAGTPSEWQQLIAYWDVSGTIIELARLCGAPTICLGMDW